MVVAFCVHTKDLMGFVSMLAVMGSFPWRAIIAAIVSVILLDASKQCSASKEGIVRPQPTNSCWEYQEGAFQLQAGQTSRNGWDEFLLHDLLKGFKGVAYHWDCHGNV